jgi:CheY-like chemotaxis protein/tetratricopeptide (TPR) repeat protein
MCPRKTTRKTLIFSEVCDKLGLRKHTAFKARNQILPMALKILVAEDDRHTRRILDHIFTKDPAFRDQEVELFLAPDGEEALKLFEKESPDLVISDLLMPRLDGFALCRAIRRLPNGKDVPVIVTSAIYKETALLNRMRDELGVEFFAKPFQVRELVRGVQRLLERRARPDTAVSNKPPTHRPTGAIQKLAGDLANRPLASMIFDLLEEQATGVLTLKRGRVKKEIYVILGHPVGAESNIRTESLGHYLVAKNVIDKGQLQRAQATSKEKRVSLMEAIVQLGWLNETDVFRHHTALVKLKIINSLRWAEGTYSFAPGDSFSGRIPKATIDIANILFLGLQRVTSLDEASQKLDAKANHTLTKTGRAERYQDVFTKVFGGDVLGLLPTGPSINEMLGKGIEPLRVYLQTHALLECGMVKLGSGKASIGSQPAVRAEDPIGLRQLKKQATRVGESSEQSDNDGLLYEEIFGVDEISVVTTFPVPEPVESRPPADSEDELAIDIQLEDDSAIGPGILSTTVARKLVVSTYLGIHDKNLYEILGVERTAPPPQIRDAFNRQADKFKVENFIDCDLGLDHPKLEEINHLLRQTLETLSDPAQRAAYDEELRTREAAGSTDPMEAENLFQQGLKLLDQGQPSEAKRAFTEALNLDPESADYYAHLAWASYQAAPESPQALQLAYSQLDQALQFNPDELLAHIFYGRICAAEGRVNDGRDHLETALDLDPANEVAFETLASIHTHNGDWKLLERQHRKVLQRLGNRQPDRVLLLWKSLAQVYSEKLEDAESARTSLEVAASMAPDDAGIIAALAELERPDPKAWRESAEKLLVKIGAQPTDAAPLQELYRVFNAADQHDAAFLSASVLVHRGQAQDDVAALHDRFRPRFLIRARQDVDAEIWSKLRHPDDDPQTGLLFEALALLDVDFDFELGDPPGLGDALDQTELPADFARVLHYICELLSLPQPRLHLLAGADQPAALVNPIAPVLVVNEALLTSTNTLELGVRLGRLAPYFWAGRAFGVTMHTKQLRNVLMGAMKVVAPKLKVDDPTGAIERISGRLGNSNVEVTNRLKEVIGALTKERSSLNITRWMKGMAGSADRLALVIGADPQIVCSLLPHRPPEVLADLCAFSLSEAHLELRRLMATSIDV